MSWDLEPLLKRMSDLTFLNLHSFLIPLLLPALRLEQKRRPLTDLQLFMAMGWRRSRYRQLKCFNVRRFLGNSMHLASVFTVAACTLACAQFPDEEPKLATVSINAAAAGA